MQIQINLTVDFADRVAAILSGLAGGGAALTAAKPAPKALAAPKTEAKSEAKSEPKAAPETPANDGPDYAALRSEATKALQAINTANGVEAVRAALKELGVANVSAIADDQLEAAIELFKGKVA